MSHPFSYGGCLITRNLSPTGWFFPIEGAPVHATVTHQRVARSVLVPRKKALIAADTCKIVAIVGAGYKVFTNREAVDLFQTFCLEAFPDTKPAEWTFAKGHGSGTRSWAALNIHHQAHAMNPNSYNRTRDLRIVVGFMREHCENGVIFEQQAATLTVPRTRQGIHSLKIGRPSDGMEALRDEFAQTLADVRAVTGRPDEALLLVRHVIGWPELKHDAKAWERTDQATLAADLATRGVKTLTPPSTP